MATKNKPAAKTAKTVKLPAPAVKKAAPSKKPVAVNSVKKVASPKATPVKKAAPAKAAHPAKKTLAVKPAISKKAAVVKKAAPVATKKAAALKNISQTVNKTTSKAKEAPKAVPAKKATTVAKVPVPAKKEAPVKNATTIKSTNKTVAPAAPVKKEVPVQKKAVPAPIQKPVAKAAPATSKKGAVTKSTSATASRIARPMPAAVPVPTPRATPAARNNRDDKKPQVVIAHRRVDNKNAKSDDSKTMINYQPDYNRSILDEPVQQQGPVYRYSDEELNEFKELINGRLEAARKELFYLQGLITRKNEGGTEDTENRHMGMEDGSGAMEREQVSQLASRQIQFINHLEKALMRIENKTYGICRVTGKLIDKARLRAVPHATLSIEAKMMMNK